MKITRKTRIGEVLQKKLKAAKILFEEGFSCMGCPMSMMETIEEGCLAHGKSEKEIDKLVERLNR